MGVKCGTETRSHIHGSSGKGIRRTHFSTRLWPFGIQHEMLMRYVILSSVTCPAVQYFTLSHKGHDFRKGLLNMKSVFGLSLHFWSETLLIPRSIPPHTAAPLQACSGPEASRNLRFPDFRTTAQDAGKFVSLTHRPPLPQEIFLVLISVRG